MKEIIDFENINGILCLTATRPEVVTKWDLLLPPKLGVTQMTEGDLTHIKRHYSNGQYARPLHQILLNFFHERLNYIAFRPIREGLYEGENFNWELANKDVIHFIEDNHGRPLGHQIFTSNDLRFVHGRSKPFPCPPSAIFCGQKIVNKSTGELFTLDLKQGTINLIPTVEIGFANQPAGFWAQMRAKFRHEHP